MYFRRKVVERISPFRARQATYAPLLIAVTILITVATHAATSGAPLRVSTYSGSTPGSRDGHRTQALFAHPSVMALAPDGRIFVTEAHIPTFTTAEPGAHRIRIIDQAGIVSTFAGHDEPGLVDGPRLSARFRGPSGLAFDRQGNIFVADRLNHRIRKIDREGNVSTFAGSEAGYRDGIGAEAMLNSPIGLCIDAEDNLFVGDFENIVIRKVTPQGEVSTYAGIPHARGAQDGFRTAATFNSPHWPAISPQGELFVADWLNGLIRKITREGVVSTFAAGWAYIESVTVDPAGAVYASVPPGGGAHLFLKFDAAGQLLWSMANPVGYRDGPAAVAEFEHYSAPLIRPDGSMLMPDAHRIRWIEVSLPCLATPDGLVGMWRGDGHPRDAVRGLDGVAEGGVTYQTGRVQEAFALNGRDGRVRVTAAAALDVGSGSGLTIEAWISPSDLLQQQPIAEWNSGSAYGAHFYISVIPPHGTGTGCLYANLVDAFGGNHVITSPSGVIQGNQFQHVALSYDRRTGNAALYLNGALLVQQNLGEFTPETRFDFLLGYRPPGFDGSPFAFAGLLDEVSLYNRALSERELAAIHAASSGGKCAPPGPGLVLERVVTLAGTGLPGRQDGAGVAAGFNSPNGSYVGLDEASYIADTLNHTIRRVDLRSGDVTTVAGTGVAGRQDGLAMAAQFHSPLGVFVDSSGSVFVADTGNHQVRKITADDPRQVVTYAGTGGPGYLDGPAATAHFNFPNDVAGDALGNIYVSEFNNHTIRKIAPDGTVTTLIGQGRPGFQDDVGTKAGLNQPAGLAIDRQGNLYITEWGSHRIRKATPAGVVTTLAGSVFPGFVNARAGAARFFRPDGIAVDPAGVLFVTENGNHAVRRIGLDGEVTTVAGNGVPGDQDGIGALARFNGPGGIGIDASGVLVIADTGNHRVRTIVPLSPPRVTIEPRRQTVRVGAAAQFSARVEGAGPFTFQWKHNGQVTAQAADAVLRVTSAELAQAGAYTVVVSNPAGTTESAPAFLDVIMPVTLVRSLPEHYAPEIPVRVRLEMLTPPQGALHAWAVEETIPGNWVVGNVSEGGAYDAFTGKVKFGPYLDLAPRVLTYEVIPPPGESGSKSFQGITSSDGYEVPVGGASGVLPPPLHPADLAPADWRLSVNEVTAYAASWQTGESWINGPNPIPVDYVTRAGFLWKRGEFYLFSPAISLAPAYWINRTVVRSTIWQFPVVRRERPSVSSATRLLPGAFVGGEPFSVRVLVEPAGGVTAYAVEDHIPPGVAVGAVSDNGQFSEVNRVVRWGPFFDDARRELTVQVSAEPERQSVGRFHGVASFDGMSAPIGGSEIVQAAIRLSFRRFSEGEFTLQVEGATGAACLIQTSPDLRTWSDLVLATNEGGLLQLVDLESLRVPVRFYRAVRQEP